MAASAAGSISLNAAIKSFTRSLLLNAGKKLQHQDDDDDNKEKKCANCTIKVDGESASSLNANECLCRIASTSSRLGDLAPPSGFRTSKSQAHLSPETMAALDKAEAANSLLARNKSSSVLLQRLHELNDEHQSSASPLAMFEKTMSSAQLHNNANMPQQQLFGNQTHMNESGYDDFEDDGLTFSADVNSTGHHYHHGVVLFK